RRVLLCSSTLQPLFSRCSAWKCEPVRAAQPVRRAEVTKMQKFVLSLAASLLLLVPGGAFADATGTAKGVDPDASAKRGSDTHVLVVGADVFIGDVVQTGPSGQV